MSVFLDCRGSNSLRVSWSFSTIPLAFSFYTSQAAGLAASSMGAAAFRAAVLWLLCRVAGVIATSPAKAAVLAAASTNAMADSFP